MRVGFTTALRILVALDNAEEVKNFLHKIGGSCDVHKDYCQCREGQLCNLALAEFLQENKATVLRQWRTILWDLEELEIISTEKVENPNNRPRRLIWLNEPLESALSQLIEKTKADVWEKWEDELDLIEGK